MKQDKNNEDMPKLEPGMVFKIASDSDWFLVLDPDARLYARIRCRHVGYDNIVEIVDVMETAYRASFDQDQVTRIVYEVVGDTRAVNATALRRLLGRNVIGDKQAEWIKTATKKKMTVAEIEEELGYGVEIISD